MAVLGQEEHRRSTEAAGLLTGARRLFRGELLAGATRSAGKLQPLVTLVEIALTLAIAVLAGTAFWALLEPLPIAQSPPAPGAQVPQAAQSVGNPFRPLTVDAPVLSEAAPEAVETSLDLKLHGVWSDGEGRGTAIILVAGATQKAFKIGDDICCGAKLEEVYADRAIISRNGAREAIYLPNGRSVGATVQPAPQLQMPAAGTPVVSVQGVDSGDGVMQMRLYPFQDGGKFEALGLRPGDVLVSLNGAPVGDAAAAMRTLSALSRDDVVTLSVNRDGVEFPIDIAVDELMGAASAMPE